MLHPQFWQITILIAFLAIPGCYWKQTTEHLSGSTIQNGLSGDFFNFYPKTGQNEVFIIRDESTYLFPPTGTLSYLFLEIVPTLIKNDQMLNLPSEGVTGRVCTEVHPGFWCGTAIGYIKFLKITSGEIDLYISIEATPEGSLQKWKDYNWDFEDVLSFSKTETMNKDF